MGINPEQSVTSESESPDEQVTWIGRDRGGFERVPAAEATASLRGAPASALETASPWRKWLLPSSVVIIALLIASASFMLLGRKPHVTPLMHQ